MVNFTTGQHLQCSMVSCVLWAPRRRPPCSTRRHSPHAWRAGQVAGVHTTRYCSAHCCNVLHYSSVQYPGSGTSQLEQDTSGRPPCRRKLPSWVCLTGTTARCKEGASLCCLASEWSSWTSAHCSIQWTSVQSDANTAASLPVFSHGW